RLLRGVDLEGARGVLGRFLRVAEGLRELAVLGEGEGRVTGVDLLGVSGLALLVLGRHHPVADQFGHVILVVLVGGASGGGGEEAGGRGEQQQGGAGAGEEFGQRGAHGALLSGGAADAGRQGRARPDSMHSTAAAGGLATSPSAKGACGGSRIVL